MSNKNTPRHFDTYGTATPQPKKKGPKIKKPLPTFREVKKEVIPQMRTKRQYGVRLFR